MPATLRGSTDLQRQQRRARGAFYTPADLADAIVERALRPCEDRAHELRILDPACGDGAFLTASLRWLAAARRGERPLSVSERLAIAARQLFGVDRDEQAAREARTNLATACRPGSPPAAAVERAARRLRANIPRGDALLGPDFGAKEPGSAALRFDWKAAFPAAWESGRDGFDVIVGNPPFLNIRRLTQVYGAEAKRYLGRRFACAEGNYDLYTLFLERAIELLRPGGRCSMIVPNKVAALRYARACREMLLRKTTIESVVDISSASWFSRAGVYPYVITFRAQPCPAGSKLAVYRAAAGTAKPKLAASPLQSNLSAEGFQLFGDLNVERRVSTIRLDQAAELHSGATGFQAARLAEHLREFVPAEPASREFIVSGNIDRFRIEKGGVRYMKRTYSRPVLATTCPLSARKQRLYGEAKIVIAGMTRRLEAAWDEAGLALGVQVYAAIPREIERRYLLGLLNSKLMTRLFTLRFGAKRLSGGYLAINKGQLAPLPIRNIDLSSEADRRRRDKIIEQVKRRESTADAGRLARIDARIDRLTYELYRLTDDEIADVEDSVSA